MKKVGEKKRCDFGQKLQESDQFGQTFKIYLDEGKGALPSKAGALCRLLLLLVMIAYTGYKTSILSGKKSIDIMQAVKENHFDDTHVFSAKQGLNTAVGVYQTNDPSTHWPLDPSYGRIRFTKW